MSIIIDLNIVCLVCLRDDGGGLQSVYAAPAMDELTIAEKISRCSELHPQADNSKLPDKICGRCLDDLAAAWRFRQNCEAANSVFRSIQQQEEEAAAHFELEVQKLKVPSGLKIKRIQPETKTYMLPLQLDEEGSCQRLENVEEVDEEGSCQRLENDEEGDEEAEDAETIADLAVIEELDDEAVREHDEGEIEFGDYYEAEEILEDEEVEEEPEEKISVERIEEEILAVNIEKSGKRKSARVASKRPAVKEDKIEIIKGKETEEECDGKRVKQQNTNTKRGRALSKKSDESAGDTKTSGSLLLKAEPEKDQEQTTNEWAADKGKGKGSHKPLMAIPTRKRKSLKHVPMKICEICGNIYKYQHALNAHMRRHTNDRQYGCELCDKAFVSNVELRRHMRVHTGHKPYTCSYCDRRFSDFGSRRKHERTHTGERPYHCNTCGKAFAYAHVLSVHLLTHTGEKKFQCNHCGKGFTKKAYLVSHAQLHARANSIGDGSAEHEDAMQQKQEIVEECIFTTEYVITEEVGELDGEKGTEVSGALKYELEMGDDGIAEEHLQEAEDGEYVLGVR